MPSVPRPSPTRALVACACALAGLAVFAAAAQAAVSVTVQPAGGGDPVTVSIADVHPDIRTTYTVGLPDGGSERVAVEGGVSLLAVLEHTQTNFDYSVIEIPRPDGSVLTVSKRQVEDPRAPVFYTGADGVERFIGPSAPGGRVVAAEDHFEVAEEVTLTQHRSSRLNIKLTPRERKIKVGGSVTFKVRVTGARPQEQIVYTWGIKNRRQVSGDSATHTQRFPKRDGVYKLLVAASIEGTDVSVSDVATITVGDPKKSEKNRDGGGDNQTGTSDSGASTGYSGAGTSYGGSPAYDSYDSYDDSYDDYYDTDSYEPLPGTSELTPDAPPPEAAEPLIEGSLLSDAGDERPQGLLDSAAKAARDGTPSSDRSGGVPETAMSVASVLALLGLGAGLELRQGGAPRLRLRLPRRGG